MSGKKILHELPVEELLKIVAGRPQDVVMDKVSEASKFIFALKIKHGDTKVSAQIVFYTYKMYKGWDNKVQSRPHFFKDFNKHFEPKRDSNGMYYLLNPKPFDLSQEAYFLMRADRRNEKKKKKITN